MINYPSNPSVNDIHKIDGRSWKWTGSSWVRVISHKELIETDSGAAHLGSYISIDSSTFTKNLGAGVTDTQKLAKAVDELLIPTSTTIDVDTLEPYDPELSYVSGVYKSYVNLSSPDIQFQTPAIYLSMFPVAVGSTPETDPYSPVQNAGLWWYLGSDPVEVTSRSTAKTTVFSEGELRAIEGAKSGDTCNILDSYLNIEIIYKFDINSTASDIPYQVVKPLDGNGRWLAQGIKNLQPSFASYSLPYSAGFNYGLSPNKIHYYKAVDLRPNAQLFVTSTFATTSSLYRSEEYAIFLDNSINTVDLAIILNIDSNLIEWVDGVSTSVIKAGKKVYLTAKWMLVSTGVYKLLIRVDPVNEEAGGGSDAYSDSRSIIGGLNGFKLRYDRSVILSSINVDATKITNILIGKNGATPATFTLPYIIASGDVIEFALTNVEPTYTYLTLNGTYND